MGHPQFNCRMPTDQMRQLSSKLRRDTCGRVTDDSCTKYSNNLIKALFTIEYMSNANVEGEGRKFSMKTDPKFMAAMSEINIKCGRTIDMDNNSADWRWIREKVGCLCRKVRYEVKKH